MQGLKRKPESLLNYFSPVKVQRVEEDKENVNIETVDANSKVKNVSHSINPEIEVRQSREVSRIRSQRLTDSEKFEVLTEKWVPPVNFEFPPRNFGNRSRKFLSSWLANFTWLAYSPAEDSAYCLPCVLFSPEQVGRSGGQSTGQFVKDGFTCWKKAIEKFQQHSSSEYHRSAVLKSLDFQNVMRNNIKSIDRVIDAAKDKELRENAERLNAIIETVIFCGRQGIALRGHLDYGDFDINQEPEVNEGNFRALLRLRIAAGDVKLKEHFRTCGKNATYISWKIENEIINACGEIIRKRIVEEVKQAQFYSVLADETTDVSTTEQFSLSLRYVKVTASGYQICERFLEFVQVKSTAGKELSKTLIDLIGKNGINLQKIRGQGYDGAAAMSGKFEGLQAWIS